LAFSYRLAFFSKEDDEEKAFNDTRESAENDVKRTLNEAFNAGM
jgi:hypothetical protein